MRQFVLACIHPRIDRTGRAQAMAIALVCVFCATPFQATAAVMCSLTERYDWVECCSSEATIVNKSLLGQKKLAHRHIEGTLALKLRVSYSAVDGSWSDFDCAELDVTVRHGVGRKQYRHIVPYSSGVSDYIEDTFAFLFEPPFRQSDVYVESIACKMPKIMLDGRSCGSDEEQEKNERERRAEQKDDAKATTLEPTKRKKSRIGLLRNLKSKHLSAARGSLHRKLNDSQDNREKNSSLEQAALNQGYANLQQSITKLAGPMRSGSDGQSHAADERCSGVADQLAERMGSTFPSQSGGIGACAAGREQLRILTYAKDNLSRNGCYSGEYDQVISKTRNYITQVC